MKKFGPGLLVAAAFIGPGTITTASLAGANFGYALLWALLFSIVATLVLQEMAARLGLVTRAGLAEALRHNVSNPWLARGAIVLVLAAIGFGNAAYEAGNIAGASLGIAALTGSDQGFWAWAIGALAAALLIINRYRLLEVVLVGLVLVMSVVFLTTLLMISPDWGAMIAAMTAPTLPDGSLLTAIALIGTTVVPYNLFLHASSVTQKWRADQPLQQALKESRWDTGLSISLGGLITLAILATAATAFFQTDIVYSASTMAVQLEPLLGSWARICFGAGLLAAGLTSAIAAPLAAAYAVCGAFDLSKSLRQKVHVAISLLVVISGTVFAALGTKPIAAIVFAQAFNGFLLPVVALFLLYVMNQKAILGQETNGLFANLLGSVVVLVVSFLGFWKLYLLM